MDNNLMSPEVVVTGKKDPSVKAGILPGEVEEHGRAIWRNSITSLGNHTLLNDLYPNKYPQS
jgi:hypothetical protein